MKSEKKFLTIHLKCYCPSFRFIDFVVFCDTRNPLVIHISAQPVKINFQSNIFNEDYFSGYVVKI